MTEIHANKMCGTKFVPAAGKIHGNVRNTLLIRVFLCVARTYGGLPRRSTDEDLPGFSTRSCRSSDWRRKLGAGHKKSIICVAPYSRSFALTSCAFLTNDRGIPCIARTYRVTRSVKGARGRSSAQESAPSIDVNLNRSGPETASTRRDVE